MIPFSGYYITICERFHAQKLFTVTIVTQEDVTQLQHLWMNWIQAPSLGLKGNDIELQIQGERRHFFYT